MRKKKNAEHLFLNRIVKKEKKQIDEQEKVKEKISAEESINEESEEELVLQEQIFLELFSSGYSMAQITEMMELKKYMKDMDASLLKKMFKNNMPSEKIRKTIEAFYG